MSGDFEGVYCCVRAGGPTIKLVCAIFSRFQVLGLALFSKMTTENHKIWKLIKNALLRGLSSLTTLVLSEKNKTSWIKSKHFKVL